MAVGLLILQQLEDAKRRQTEEEDRKRREEEAYQSELRAVNRKYGRATVSPYGATSTVAFESAISTAGGAGQSTVSYK